MAGLVTVQDLREIFEIGEDIKDPRLKRHIAAAGRRLRSWVSDAVYEAAQGNAPEDADQQQDLQLAEAHLAMHFAILGLNTALRPTGVVRTERVEGDTVISYHSPGEVEKLQQLYLATAEVIARPYLTESAGSTDSLAFAVVEDESCSGEASTRPCGCSWRAPCCC